MKTEVPSCMEIKVPFTAFPNLLLDQVMPTLKDTEWRLLCVVVRQTLGWRAGPDQRKTRDWMTQRQLMARTGRNSAALSAAIDTLVRRRLVDVWDEAGDLLLTPQERRRCQGRLYFGLCRQSVQASDTESARTPPHKTPLHKVNTTKETEDKRKIIRKEEPIQQAKTNNPRERNLPHLTLYTGWDRVDRVVASRYFGESDNTSPS